MGFFINVELNYGLIISEISQVPAVAAAASPMTR